MKRPLKLTIFLILLGFMPSQAQAQNPFEIRDRLQTGEVPGDSLTPSIQNQNAGSLPEGDTPVDPSAFSQARQTHPDNPFEIREIPAAERKVQSEQLEQVEHAAETEPAEVEKALQSLIRNQTDSASSDNFLFWLILACFLILAIMLSLDRFYITRLFKSILNYNLANTVMRDNTGRNLIKMIMLYTLFLLSASLFVYIYVGYASGHSGWYYFLLSAGGVAGVYFVRHASLRLVYLIFNRVPELKQYSFTIAHFNIVLGIVLLVPVLLAAFSPMWLVKISIFIGFGLFGLFYLLRTLRGLLISFNYLVTIPFHFFLYLCAFEIIPLMVMYRILTDFA